MNRNPIDVRIELLFKQRTSSAIVARVLMMVREVSEIPCLDGKDPRNNLI